MSNVLFSLQIRGTDTLTGQTTGVLTESLECSVAVTEQEVTRMLQQLEFNLLLVCLSALGSAEYL